MANLEEVFKQEWGRENSVEWNKIHLYKMGDFWRAYEWSAWLISVISYNDNLRLSMFGDGEFAELIEYDADMRKGWLKVA